jgi:hypothetical protein
MKHNAASSFGLYETTRIIVPGFYFTSLCVLFFYSFLSHYVDFSLEPGVMIILFLFLVLVSGLSMYAKETTKRRRAFIDNQPSIFLQDIARRNSVGRIFNKTEARQLYFYILNHFIPPAFHDKIFFFGTVYHIMVQIRRTSFWFSVLALMCIAVQSSMGISLVNQQGLIAFCMLVSLLYLLNVKYNKADRKMQENYQDQIFWLHMNEDIVNELIQKPNFSRKDAEL